jgi:excisionase family DNA binding protein
MKIENEDYKVFWESILNKWNLPEAKFTVFLDKQLDHFPGKLFEKHFLLDFLYQDLETIKPDHVKQGGLVIRGKKEKPKPKLDLYDYQDKFQVYYDWLVSKKIAVDKELFLPIWVAIVELKKWIDPEYEINYLKNQIETTAEELENNKLKDGSPNPLFKINNLYKEGKYPDLFNTDINQVIEVELRIAYRSFLKDRLYHKEKPVRKDEIIIQAAIIGEKDTMGNLTLNFPMNILKESIKDLVTAEKENPIEAPSQRSTELLTRKEAAAYLKITLVTLDKWKDEGRIRAYRLGDKKIRYKKEDVEALLEEIKRHKFHI